MTGPSKTRQTPQAQDDPDNPPMQERGGEAASEMEEVDIFQDVDMTDEDLIADEEVAMEAEVTSVGDTTNDDKDF